jgi:sugar phosphate isomerase/epimerase
MKYAFCSYSFHRMLEAGKQDIFQHIKDVKELGACQIDPWNAHLAVVREGDKSVKPGDDPEKASLTSNEIDYLKSVTDAAQQAGLPWGCIAADGAHIYEETEEKRRMTRCVAHRWLQVAQFLGATQVRIDAGGPENMPDNVFPFIVKGYNELISRAKEMGIQILVENHWGPIKYPSNAVKLLEAVKGLGMLFDTNNWAKGFQEEGWERCAKYAAETHVKTFAFDQNGWDPTVDLKKAIKILVDNGYNGVWGIESCPRDGNEMEGARKTVQLIKMALGEK